MILVAADTGSEKKIKAYLKSIRVRHPYIYDPSERIINEFGSKKLPLTIFIGKSGTVVEVTTGFSRSKRKNYQKIIKSLESR